MSTSAQSNTGTATEIARYQYQKIDLCRQRHNGQNTASILKWGEFGEQGMALQHPFKPISDIFHGLEVSIECGCVHSLSPCFVYGPRLVTIKPSAEPEEMWAQDVLSLGQIQSP